VKASKDKAGTATITATSKNGLTATCVITVAKSLSKAAPDAVTVEAAQPRIALKLTGGGYASSDNHVADVDGSGNVELKADGAATLTAGNGQIQVKVEGGNPVELKLDEGEQLTLTSDSPVRWSAKGGSAASIDENGRLAALQEGTATVVCEADGGWKWEIRIDVERPGVVQLPDTSAQTPEPAPTPEVSPTPEPSPEPSPSEEPVPSLQPEPEPTEEPAPTPEPEKAPDPKPEPDTEASPEPDAA
jgi:hypothetical protein